MTEDVTEETTTTAVENGTVTIPVHDFVRNLLTKQPDLTTEEVLTICSGRGQTDATGRLVGGIRRSLLYKPSSKKKPVLRSEKAVPAREGQEDAYTLSELVLVEGFAHKHGISLPRLCSICEALEVLTKEREEAT